MAFLKIWQVSRAIMRLLVIQFVCWLGWFSTFALAQFEISEGVTGSVNFPALGVTCVANLAVFVTSLIRGRMDLEMGARDVLDILLSPKLQNIKRIKHGYGLTTCDEGGGDLPTASAEQVPQTASREESDVRAASTERVAIHIEEEERARAAVAAAEEEAEAAAARARAAAARAAEEERARPAVAAAARAAEEERARAAVAANEGGGDLPTASAEQVPQTASREESDVHAASTRGTETASTEGNVNTSASTERGGLQTASTSEAVIHIDSTKGQVGSEGGGGAAAAAAAEALKEAKEALKEAKVKEAKQGRGGAAAEAASAAAFEARVIAEEALKEAAGGGEGLTLEEAKEALKEAEEARAAAAAFRFAREKGLESAGVIMLSNDTANWSMKQFMKSNAYVVQSIVLPFLPLKRALNDTKVSEELTSGVTIKSCKCKYRSSRCHCIVLWTMEEITDMLATRMPATLKLLSNSLCLLPCSTCLRKGCHECNRENLLRAESEADEGQPMRQRVVSDILDNIRAGDIPAGKPIGICVPMNDAHGDDWTKLLLKSLRSKDAEGRGVTNKAAEALEGYLAGGRGSEKGIVEYDIFSFVVPRLTEVLINLVLTFWFRVDAFSSALLARRTVRDYLVDTKSSGFAANAFLTEAVVKSNGDNSQVCQVLTFRGRDWLCFISFISVGCVNVICALGWSLLISFEGGPDTSQPPSLPRVAVIIAAIGSPWVVATATKMGMEMGTEEVPLDDIGSFLSFPVEFCLKLFSDITTVRLFVVRLLGFLLMTGCWFVTVFVLVLMILVYVVLSPLIWPGGLVAGLLIERREEPYAYPLMATGFLFEMACFVSWSALAGALGIKAFGRWLYAALQILIWVKWATGSLLLNEGEENSSEFFGRIPDRFALIFYSSAFWLNAVLAGVRCKWEAWPWKHNHLF